MRTVVFGYHNVGYVCLRQLLQQGHEVAALVTHSDDPEENVWFKSVAELAHEHAVPVFTPDNPNVPEFVNAIGELHPDIVFSFYYRHMLKRPLLELAPLGALNMHGSYLPKYRGRCPVNWVLVNGEASTGVTLHYMVEKPDAGDIVAQRKVPIAFDDTAPSLYAKMTQAAETLFTETLPILAAGTAPRIPQDHSQATYYGGRRPADGCFSWDDSAVNIYNLVRAVTHPYPGAFADFGTGRLFVWWCEPQDGPPDAGGKPGTVTAVTSSGPLVATADGQLLLLSLQVDDGPILDGREFAAAYALCPGDSLLSV